MKYVNPISSHLFNSHRTSSAGEGQQTADKNAMSGRPRTRKRLGSQPLSQPNGLGTVALALGCTAIGFLAAWRISKGFRIQELKVGRLEIEELKIHRNAHERVGMEETGGILRFELGPSDVYENGLE